MINKSKLWFLTLSGIVLVLAVYYIAFPETEIESVFKANGEKTSVEQLTVESEAITAMKIESDSKYEEELNVLQQVLLNSSKTKEEKSEAYDEIKYLNNKKALEEKIMKIVDAEFKVSSFVDIKETTVQVIVDNGEYSYTLANNIIRKVNESLDQNYYVTVKFE